MPSYLVKTSFLLGLISATSLAATADSDQYGDNGNPRLNLSVDPGERTVAPGGSAMFELEVKGVGNFNGTVQLAATGLPAGVIVTFSPASLTLKNGQKSESSALLSVPTSLQPGRYPFTFVVNGGAASDISSATLNVSGQTTAGDFSFAVSPDERSAARGGEAVFSLSLSRTGAGTTTANLSLKNPPAGISVLFAPSPSVVITGGQTALATATVKVGASVQPGNYTLVFAADNATTHRERSVLLRVPGAGDFTFDVSPESRTLVPSTQIPFTLRLESRNGFAGVVNLSAAGLPPGAVIAFQPGNAVNLLAGGTAIVTAVITTGPQALAGNFPIRFMADSGSIHREDTVVLGGQDDSGFEFEIVPGVDRILPGGTAKFALILVARLGFSGPVKLSVPSPPPGFVISYDPASAVQLSSGKTSVVTLLVQTPAGTAIDDYPLTVLADAGAFAKQERAVVRVANLQAFSLSSSPLTRTVPPGGAASYELTLASLNQFAGAVEVLAEDLPPGASAVYTPSNTAILPAGGQAKVIATVLTSASTPAGSYLVVFRARSSGYERQVTVRLSVSGNALFSFTASPLLRIVPPNSTTSFGFTLNSLNNFSGQVTVTPGSLPAGVTATLAPPSPVTLPPAGTVGVVAQMTIGPAVPAGKYPIRFTASSGGASSDVLVMLWVTTEQGYFFEVIPDSREVAPGNQTSYVLKLTSIGSFAGAVQLSAQGFPSGAAAGFQPASVVNLAAGQTQSVTANVATSTSTPLGPSSIKFNADSGSLHKEETVLLRVIQESGFRLEINPSSRTVAPGAAANYVLTLSSIGGFAGPVSLAALDLPQGFTPSFIPSGPVQLASGAVEVIQLHLSTPVDASAGPNPFKIRAQSGATEAVVSARVVISHEHALSVNISPSSRNVLRGETANFTVRVASLTYQGPVVLTAAGLPQGAIVFSPGAQFSIKPGESADVQLAVTPGAGASTGTYNFTVSAGTSTPLTAEDSARLIVLQTQPGADFAMTVLPPIRLANSGSTAVYKVLLTSLGAFRGAVRLSVAGFPPGSVKWAPDDSVYLEEGETQSVSLLIKTEKGAEERLYPLTIIADSGALHRESTGVLVVVKTRGDDDDDDYDDDDDDEDDDDRRRRQ
jgi:uncharacterized membrane protein